MSTDTFVGFKTGTYRTTDEHFETKNIVVFLERDGKLGDQGKRPIHIFKCTIPKVQGLFEYSQFEETSNILEPLKTLGFRVRVYNLICISLLFVELQEF